MSQFWFLMGAANVMFLVYYATHGRGWLWLVLFATATLASVHNMIDAIVKRIVARTGLDGSGE